MFLKNFVFYFWDGSQVLSSADPVCSFLRCLESIGFLFIFLPFHFISFCFCGNFLSFFFISVSLLFLLKI